MEIMLEVRRGKIAARIERCCQCWINSGKVHRLISRNGGAGGGSLAAMQILQGRDFSSLLEHGANSARSGVGSGKRGDAGNVVANGGPANGLFVVERFAAERRVDDQIDFSRFHQVDDIR